MERGNEVGAPLTPVGLQRLLEQTFDIYRKRESAALPVAVAPVEDEVGELPEKQRQGSFSAFFTKSYHATSAYVKQKATDVKKVAVKAKHSTVIQFVSEEMEDILRQQASAVKKMTDLSILLHGLHYYITMQTNFQ